MSILTAYRSTQEQNLAASRVPTPITQDKQGNYYAPSSPDNLQYPSQIAAPSAKPENVTGFGQFERPSGGTPATNGLDQGGEYEGGIKVAGFSANGDEAANEVSSKPISTAPVFSDRNVSMNVQPSSLAKPQISNTPKIGPLPGEASTPNSRNRGILSNSIAAVNQNAQLKSMGYPTLDAGDEGPNLPTSNMTRPKSVSGFADGGEVPHPIGKTDTVPAMLTPGELVITKQGTDKLRDKYGELFLKALVKGDVKGFADGGMAKLGDIPEEKIPYPKTVVQDGVTVGQRKGPNFVLSNKGRELIPYQPGKTIAVVPGERRTPGKGIMSLPGEYTKYKTPNEGVTIGGPYSNVDYSNPTRKPEVLGLPKPEGRVGIDISPSDATRLGSKGIFNGAKRFATGAADTIIPAAALAYNAYRTGEGLRDIAKGEATGLDKIGTGIRLGTHLLNSIQGEVPRIVAENMRGDRLNLTRTPVGRALESLPGKVKDLYRQATTTDNEREAATSPIVDVKKEDTEAKKDIAGTKKFAESMSKQQELNAANYEAAKKAGQVASSGSSPDLDLWKAQVAQNAKDTRTMAEYNAPGAEEKRQESRAIMGMLRNVNKANKVLATPYAYSEDTILAAQKAIETFNTWQNQKLQQKELEARSTEADKARAFTRETEEREANRPTNLLEQQMAQSKLDLSNLDPEVAEKANTFLNNMSKLVPPDYKVVRQKIATADGEREEEMLIDPRTRQAITPFTDAQNDAARHIAYMLNPSTPDKVKEASQQNIAKIYGAMYLDHLNSAINQFAHERI